MGKIDYHLHTEGSYDSQIKSTALAAKAIELGYDEIAITEHLDLLPQEVSVFGLPSLSRYQQRIKQLNMDFPELKILLGIEVGDYHRVKDYAKPLLDMIPFELILGSVHFLSDHSNVAIPFPHPLSNQQREDYFRQNLALVTHCDIDVLAHLGVYKRYYPELVSEASFHPIIRDIFTVMIDREIALEINFSSLRKTYPSLIPEPGLVEMYLNMGGKLVTIGSDAHCLDHFDDYYAAIPQHLQVLANMQRKYLTNKAKIRLRKHEMNINNDKGEQPCPE